MESVCGVCLTAGCTLAGKSHRAPTEIDQFVNIFKRLFKGHPLYKVLKKYKKSQNTVMFPLRFGLTLAMLNEYLNTRDNKELAIHWMKQATDPNDDSFSFALAAIILNQFEDLYDIFSQGLIEKPRSRETYPAMVAYAIALSTNQDEIKTVNDVKANLPDLKAVEDEFDNRRAQFKDYDASGSLAMHNWLYELLVPSYLAIDTPTPFVLTSAFMRGGSRTPGRGRTSVDSGYISRWDRTQTLLPYLHAGPSTIANAGTGLHALEDIPANRIITVYGGEIIHNPKEYTKDWPQSKKQWFRTLSQGQNATVIDGSVHDNYTLEWYAEHHYLASIANEDSRGGLDKIEENANSVFVNVGPAKGAKKGMIPYMHFQMYSPDDEEGQSAPSAVFLMSTKPIVAGDEIFVYYGKGYDRTAYT